MACPVFCFRASCERRAAPCGVIAVARRMERAHHERTFIYAVLWRCPDDTGTAGDGPRPPPTSTTSRNCSTCSSTCPQSAASPDQRQLPERIQGDRGYDSEPLRVLLRRLGITPILAKRNTEQGSGLGEHRWFVERTISWLHSFGRLRRRLDRLVEIQEAFLRFGCAMVCLGFLTM